MAQTTWKHVYNFSGGLSDDAYYVAPGQFPSGYGVDVRRYPRFVQLQRKQNSTLALGTSLAISALYKNPGLGGTNSGGMLWGTDTGEIWSSIGTTLKKLYIPDIGVPKAYALAMFNERWYVFNSTAAYYIGTNFDVTTTDAWTGFMTEIDTRSPGATSYKTRCYTLNWAGNNGRLYFTDKNELKFFSKATPLTPESANFLSESDIVGLTQHGDCFWIYCANGMQYAYDPGNDGIIGTKDWGEPILFVKGRSDVDYVVTGVAGSFTSLYVNSGVQPGSQALLKKNKYDSDSSTAFSLANPFLFSSECLSKDTMAYVRGILYVPGVYDTSKRCIYSYGKRGDGFPNSMATDYLKNYAGTKVAQIGVLATADDAGGFYYSWYDGAGTNGIDYVNTELETSVTYLAQGEFILPSDDTTTNVKDQTVTHDLNARKEISNVMVGADVPTGCSIEIYAIRDNASATGVLYCTLNPSTKRWQNFNAPSGEFNEIKWKVVLKGNGTATPKFYDLKYDVRNVGVS